MYLSELLAATALEQALLIRKGEVSSQELVHLYLERIELLNPKISAFVDVMRDRALREARCADKRRRRGDRAAFLGVPIGVKDLDAAKGSFTRMGSRAFERLFTPFDDATVATLRKGGFVILGKTATSELGSLPVVEPEIHPPTRNPWDLAVTAGGSSGGSGAAVAARMIPIAQGSDAAGSIRIPASFGHLFGIKPSRGRVENPFGMEDRTIIWSTGPITRTVDDAAALLDVMSGVAFGRPHWAPPPPRPFAELARETPRRLRVRFATRLGYVATTADIDAAVRRVARKLEELGHEVAQAPMLEGSVEEFLPVWQATAAGVPVYDWSMTQEVTRWLADRGRGLRKADIEILKAKIERQVLEWFGDVDLWITPTVCVEPPAVFAWKGLPPAEVFAHAATLGVFTAPFNASGQPAASIPAGLSSKGHPIGVQLAGPKLADGLVLAVARQLEEAMPWRDVAPPLAGL